MKIGIIFAMQEELDALKKYINIQKIDKIYDLEIIEGSYKDKTCYLLKSGVGKVNSARATQVLIDNKKVNYIFNIGVAGGIDYNLQIGNIIIGEKLFQYDFDLTAFGRKKGVIPNIGEYVLADSYLISKTKEINNSNVKYGNIATGDMFCTDVKQTKKINEDFQALCVEMEGASIAQTCYLSNIPFLIIRSISDIPNNDNKIVYEEFLESSSKMVATYLIDLLNII